MSDRGKWWHKMAVPSTNEEKCIELLINEPTTNHSIPSNNNYLVKLFNNSNYDVDTNNIICRFIEEHNKALNTDSSTLITYEEIISYLNLNSTFYLLYLKSNDRLLGINLAIHLPFKSNLKTIILQEDNNLEWMKGNSTNNNVNIITLTTYLCIDQKCRNKSLAMLLIRNVINNQYQEGSIAGYHLMPNQPYPSMKINQWFRPLNVETMIDIGFNISNNTNKNRIKLRYKLPKQDNSISHIEINEHNYDDVLEFWYTKYRNVNGLIYWPSKEHLVKLSKIFNIHVITNKKDNTNTNNKENIIGLTIIKTCLTKIRNKEVKVGILLLSLFDSNNKDIIDNVLQSALHISSKLNHICLYMYEVGYISNKTNILEGIKAIRGDVDLYLGLFNFNITYNPENIHLLLF